MTKKKAVEEHSSKAAQKVSFRNHLIVIGLFIIVIFLFAVVYSSYEGNIAGEASRRGTKVAIGDKAMAERECTSACVNNCRSTTSQTVEECKTACKC